MKMIFLLGCLFSTQVMAGLSLRYQWHQQEYKVDVSKTDVSLFYNLEQIEVENRSCNGEFFESFRSKLSIMLQKQELSQKSPLIVQVNEVEKKLKSDSPLANYLIALPKEVIELKAKSEAICSAKLKKK